MGVSGQDPKMSASVMGTNSSDDFDISRARTIIRGNSVDNSYYVALDHAYVVDVAVFLCHLQKMLNEVHDVGASVHVIL